MPSGSHKSTDERRLKASKEIDFAKPGNDDDRYDQNDEYAEQEHAMPPIVNDHDTMRGKRGGAAAWIDRNGLLRSDQSTSVARDTTSEIFANARPRSHCICGLAVKLVSTREHRHPKFRRLVCVFNFGDEMPKRFNARRGRFIDHLTNPCSNGTTGPEDCE